MLLTLEPSDALYVCVGARGSVPYTVLRLQNAHAGNIAFKAKLKVPKAYIVRPTSGTLGPRECQDVHIIPTPEDVGSHVYDEVMLVKAIAVRTLDPVTPAYWAGLPAHSVEEHKLRLTEELQFAPAEIRASREVVLHSVAKRGMALEFASGALRGDREVVLCAVEDEGLALQFASDELRGDREVVFRAVEQQGMALQFASEALRGDPAAILAAVVHGSLDLDSDGAPEEARALREGVAENRSGRMFQLTLMFLERAVVLEKARTMAEDAYAIECLVLARHYVLEQKSRLPKVEHALEQHLEEDVLARRCAAGGAPRGSGHTWAARVAAGLQAQEIQAVHSQVNDGHTFFFVNADCVRRHDPEQEIPRCQDLDRSWLNLFRVPRRDAHHAGRFASREFLLVSHRWEHPQTPDPSGIQLRAIQAHLRKYPDVKWVWYDYWCLPQGADLTGGESAFLASTAAQMPWLYLTVPVLIVYDLAYTSRFWTSLEAFLSMHQVTPYGLKTNLQRHEVVAVGVARHSENDHRQLLRNLWAVKPWAEVAALLQDSEFHVTVESDKAMQLRYVGKIVDKMSRRNSLAQSDKDSPTIRWDANPAQKSEAALREAMSRAFTSSFGDHRRTISRGEFHALMKNIDPMLEDCYLDRVFVRLSGLDYEKLIGWIFE